MFHCHFMTLLSEGNIDSEAQDKANRQACLKLSSDMIIIHFSSSQRTLVSL